MTDRRVVIDLNALRQEADKKMELGALRYIVREWALIPAMPTQELRNAAERRMLDRAGLLWRRLCCGCLGSVWPGKGVASMTEDREAIRRRWVMTCLDFRRATGFGGGVNGDEG